MSTDANPIVLIIKNKTEIKKINLESTPITIGRSSKANIKIDDEELSSVHCEISVVNELVLVRDLNSKNGSFIDNIPITHEDYLFLNDTLYIGKTKITIDPSNLSGKSLSALDRKRRLRTGIKPRQTRIGLDDIDGLPKNILKKDK